MGRQRESKKVGEQSGVVEVRGIHDLYDGKLVDIYFQMGHGGGLLMDKNVAVCVLAMLYVRLYKITPR